MDSKEKIKLNNKAVITIRVWSNENNDFVDSDKQLRKSNGKIVYQGLKILIDDVGIEIIKTEKKTRPLWLETIDLTEQIKTLRVGKDMLVTTNRFSLSDWKQFIRRIRIHTSDPRQAPQECLEINNPSFHKAS